MPSLSNCRVALVFTAGMVSERPSGRQQTVSLLAGWKAVQTQQMKWIASAVLLLAVCLNPAATPCASAAEAKDSGNWELLFNGKDLTGWQKVHDVTFVATNGNLRLVTGMGWLRTERVFTNFVLEVEWRALDTNYDSGVFIRAGWEGKPW